MLARSVVRSMSNNRRVKQDPELIRDTDDQTSIDKTFKDDGKKPYIPAEEDTYAGKSELRYSNGNMEQNPYIRHFPRTKKVLYDQTRGMEKVPENKDEFPTEEEQKKQNKTV